MQIITMTDKAIDRIRSSVSGVDGCVGVKVSVSQSGCFGLKYKFDYLYELSELDIRNSVEVDKHIKVVIDSAAVMYLIGSVMDYEEDQINQRFVFRNPNEQGKCGCGESFYV